MIIVKFLNRNGGGFADPYEIEEGTSLADFLSDRGINSEANDYTIRVNGQIAFDTYVLKNGDSIIASPTKVAGA